MSAAAYSLPPEPFYLSIGIAAAGLLFSVLFVRESIHHGPDERRDQDQERELAKIFPEPKADLCCGYVHLLH